MGTVFLEEWLQRDSLPSPSPSPPLPTAREIAHSWTQLRECLQKGELQGANLTCLQKLEQCRHSLHVADPQAKLLLWLLSSENTSADPGTTGRARGSASLILSAWARKSSASNSLLDAAAGNLCKSMEDEEQRRFFLCEGILLAGCLSAARNLSERSRGACLELVAELLRSEKQTLRSQGRIAEALAGAGYALIYASNSSYFRSVLASLLSLWDAVEERCPGIREGLMVLHLMEWFWLSLLRPQTANPGAISVVDSMNTISAEVPRAARGGKPGLGFAAVMAAAGILRACDRNPVNAPVAQLVSCMEETIFMVAENVMPNFSPSVGRTGNSDSCAEPLQFGEWDLANECSLGSMRRLILQCMAVALPRCGEIRPNESVLMCLVAALLTETFPLNLMYSEKMTCFSGVSALDGVRKLGRHVDGVLFREAGATTRVMCNQYRTACMDSKRIIEDMMWEYSRALYRSHRPFAFVLKSSQQSGIRDLKSADALEKITEAAFFMIVMFFSTATEDRIALENSCDALENSCDVQERISVRALDALSCLECFRRLQIPEYGGVVQRAVSCVSKSISACAALICLLPSYQELTHWPGPSNLGHMEYCWSKDEVQTAQIFFYLRILPIFAQKIPDSVFGMDVAPLIFLYMHHPVENVARGSHLVFAAFISANSPGLDLSHVEQQDKATLKEQLAAYYILRALEEYPGLTPLEGLVSGTGAVVRHLPAGSPAILYCINILVEKINGLYNAALTNQQEVKGGTDSAQKLQVLLLHLILLVDIQVLPDLLKLLAQLIVGLPEHARMTALNEIYDVVAGSDDVTRKPLLVPWFQSLSYICTELNSGDIKSKENLDRSDIVKQKDVHRNTDKSACVNLNPTCRKYLMQVSRL